MKILRIIIGLCTLLFVILVLFYQFGRPIWVPIKHEILGKQTVQSVLDKIGPYHDDQWRQIFTQKQISYPPQNLTLIALKAENKLEVWSTIDDENILLKTYDILAASGLKGPKLIEGDRQVPEGIYRLIGFNPNSAYHLSIKINYPNRFDMKHAKIEGREKNPGSNIFIHGKALSIGCLAMGDSAIEEIFTLTNRVGLKNISLIIAPNDPRKDKLINQSDKVWVDDLYENITKAIMPFNHTR